MHAMHAMHRHAYGYQALTLKAQPLHPCQLCTPFPWQGVGGTTSGELKMEKFPEAKQECGCFDRLSKSIKFSSDSEEANSCIESRVKYELI